MKKTQSRIILILATIIVLLIIHRINMHQNIDVHFLQKYNIETSNFVANHYALSVLVLFAAIICSIIFFIPLTPLFNIAAGYFFGFFFGSIYCLISATIGAICAFLIFRYLLKDMVQQYFGKRLQKFNNEIRVHGAKYLLSLELLPITPFGVIVVLASLSVVSLFTFIWTTFVGIIPSTLFYVYTGKELMSINSFSDLWSIKFIIMLVILTALASLPIMLRFIPRAKNIRNRLFT